MQLLDRWNVAIIYLRIHVERQMEKIKIFNILKTVKLLSNSHQYKQSGNDMLDWPIYCHNFVNHYYYGCKSIYLTYTARVSLYLENFQ